MNRKTDMGTGPAALLELRERVRAATGSDREIDGALEVEARRFEAYAAGLNDETRAKWRHNGPTVFDGNTGYTTQNFTSSIDAALALVERVLPGWTWCIDTNDQLGVNPDGWAWATIRPNASRDFWRSTAPTPPLAILGALLSALIEQARSADSSPPLTTGGE